MSPPAISIVTERPEILPTTKVAALLKDYPELEELLISKAPPFKKLRNPLLRRTVAKVASLRQVAAVGKIPIARLVNDLRSEVGQPPLTGSFEQVEYFGKRPKWFSSDLIKATVDEDRTDPDDFTLNLVLAELRRIEDGEVVLLVTSFLPAPGIDRGKALGHQVWSEHGEGEQILTYFRKVS